MRIVGTHVVNNYFADHGSDSRIKAARSSYRAWEEITRVAEWSVPQDVKASHPKASILKGARVVFNIKANDYRLICQINYQINTVVIRWFGSHDEYDDIDADSI